MFWVWAIVMFKFCIDSTRSQALDITRLNSGLDTFKVPPSICSNPSTACSSYNAVGSTCSCSCAATRSTLTFFNNQWQCLTNAAARKHFQTGCDRTTSFSGENRDGRLPTLAIGQKREISLEYWPWEVWTCSLDLPSSWFMGCDGSKYLFRNRVYNASARLFSISRSSPTARYILQVNSGVQDSPLLKGKVINLVMNCAATWFGTPIVDLRSCLVFKLEGTETCPVNNPSNSTNSSSYVASLSMSRTETQTPIISSSASVATPLTVIGTTLASYSSVTSLTTSYSTSVIPTTSPIPCG